MSDIIKSVLFVDYDSLYLSLRDREPGIARRFASRPGAWVDAIERGVLIDGARRRVLMRRCYADPKLLGNARSAFTASGFQILDCPPLPGRERNAAEIHMALDVVDALGHSTGFEEFILLSADTDLSPLVIRLRAHARLATVYATPTTSVAYRAMADGTLDESALVATLAPTADAESPEIETSEVEIVRPGIADRDELAALARRIHNATNVPLLSPKVYGELFRALASEVSENGYHFQATAENVAARLGALGRNTSRRQIAFVVKGLALRGHVFSASDSPERLAEVFLEQVFYLIRAASIELDDDEIASVRAWIQGRTLGPSQAQPQLRAPSRPQRNGAETPAQAPPARPERLAPIPMPPPPIATPQAPPRPAAAQRPVAAPSRPAASPSPTRFATRPAAAAPEPPPRPAVLVPEPPPAPYVPPERPRMPPPPRPQAMPPRPKPQPIPYEEPVGPPVAETMDAPQPRAAIAPPRPRSPAPRPSAASAEPVRPAPPRPVRPAAAASAAAAIRPPAKRNGASAVARETQPSPEDPIETSILAAIAEAVDVLVDEQAPVEMAPPPPPPPRTGQAQPIQAPPPPPPQNVEPEPVDDDGDIGDEIQRILSAYSQNRKPPARN